MLFSVILIYKTIKSNERLNQKILFTNITKEERELKIKLNEYRDIIKKTNSEEAIFDYDSLLFNYYEYLAICVRKELIDEFDAKLYFKTILSSVKDRFENSLLFKENLVKKDEYLGIQWLFKRWNVEY